MNHAQHAKRYRNLQLTYKDKAEQQLERVENLLKSWLSNKFNAENKLFWSLFDDRKDRYKDLMNESARYKELAKYHEAKHEEYHQELYPEGTGE